MKIVIMALVCFSFFGLQLFAKDSHSFRQEVSYTPQATTFTLFAPSGAKRVNVRLYDDARQQQPVMTIGMKRAGRDLWRATVKRDLQGKFYTFDAGCGETPGVFAKAVGVNGQRGVIVDMAATNPAGWDTDVCPGVQPADMVIYEMHHRDFSIARSDARWPGKFLALTEPWAIEHLKRLGVNAVHLLPSFDYASVDESRPDVPQYNWGYDPLNYNVPEGSYATDAQTPEVRIREFKTMVQALHKAGISVILDVVYNHTFDLENSNFQKTYPGYFYRYNAHGTPSNGSGCGNETASEKPKMRQYMLESMQYWIDEYHIDGFRIDLMGVHDINTIVQLRARLNSYAGQQAPQPLIYGEGWSAGTCAYPQEQLAMKAHMTRLPGVAAFSDDLRDALRGPFSDDTQGAFLAGKAGEEESVKTGIAGMIGHPQVDYSKVNYSTEPWALEPTQMISYVSCHDDMCLVDRLRTELPGIDDEALVRLDLLAQTAVFTSQGIPFLLSGEELLRDKQGVHNSYNAPDSINHLDWSSLQRHPEVFDYYRGLITMRQHHPVFHMGDANLVRQHLSFLPTQPCLVAFWLTNPGTDTWNKTLVVLNAATQAREIALPEGTYTVVCCGTRICEQGLVTFTGSNVCVPAQSALILHN